MAWAGLRKCYAVGRCASVGGVSGWQTIARGRRVGAERYAQHPMTAQAVAVDALWKESAVVIASKVRSEWPGKVQKDGAGKTRVPVFWGERRCCGRPVIV